MKRAGAVVGSIGLALVSWSCASAPGVRTEQAAQRAPVPPANPSIVEWSACEDIDPDLSMQWECAAVEVPLEHGDPRGEQIEVALTRPELDDDDNRTPLLFNPGGPGGSGIDMVWYLTDVLPYRLLDHYYPVGWDPRGVGRSTPLVDCGPLDEYSAPDAADCTSGTGPLLAQLGAPDAAEDMEAIRVALGVERLDYVGYSYGTALGAVYAMHHPERVGRFVLDGAIDPTAGDPEGDLVAGGIPGYAADELDAVIERFHELCDATEECAAGPDSVALVEDLESSIRELPTAYFAGDPARLDRFGLADLLAGVTFDPWSWGVIGDALRDAADGDASTLAALSSYLLEGYPPIGPGEDGPPPPLPNADVSNFAIFCADFSHLADIWGCEGMPDADHLPVITAVDVAQPILVIGTSYDPVTPGRHAAELAAALGDAVAVTWDGVGHTAFPVSECLDDTVVDYLVDGVVPEAGRVCPFVDDIDDDGALGDYLFEYPPWWIETVLEGVLVAEGMADDQALCVARELSTADHRVITHTLLGVQSPLAVGARSEARAAC